MLVRLFVCSSVPSKNFSSKNLQSCQKTSDEWQQFLFECLLCWKWKKLLCVFVKFSKTWKLPPALYSLIVCACVCVFFSHLLLKIFFSCHILLKKTVTVVSTWIWQGMNSTCPAVTKDMKLIEGRLRIASCKPRMWQRLVNCRRRTFNTINPDQGTIHLSFSCWGLGRPDVQENRARSGSTKNNSDPRLSFFFK